MKYIVYFKFSSEIFDDQKAAELMVERQVRDTKIKALRESLKLCGSVSIRMSLDGDDFVKNMSVALLTFQAYKVPRIVKKLLFKSSYISPARNVS